VVVEKKKSHPPKSKEDSVTDLGYVKKKKNIPVRGLGD
jgi:hypothetical protein